MGDHKYIDQIRQALWCRKEFGRAAVMIGSGFSRNADPIRPGVKPMPDWKGLIGHFVNALYPASEHAQGERDKLFADSVATSAALRLADEYEAAFGRTNLEELLLREIPDEAYLPGTLHSLLLQLPWADVLTTNYDTLLERAAPLVAERRYDVVRVMQDIPSAMRPRIIKLHGSFPSTRPYIITEEDFRTYPQSFSVFVNLAQQSIMENVFCLLGFSGDDPNFLYWTGWVRDNLANAAPKVFLCGLLTLSDSQRRLLDRRNVIPIDLSPMFRATDYPDPGQRHRLAMEWLLLSLEAGRPPEPIDWPNPPQGLTPPSPELPTIVPPAFKRPVAESWRPGQ